jgi:molybdate transport system ATP-binding protein
MALYVKIKKKLQSFDLDVEFETSQEIFAVLGSSGCGKSMTLKCIAGIVQPDEGIIELDGKILFDSKKRINLPVQQRQVGYLFQSFALFKNMTVKKNISCMLSSKDKNRIAEDYIKKFKLEGLAERYPHELSGGQQQRVALARIFASQPKLLMLDEPFSAMDSFLKWQLEQEMMDLIDDYDGHVLFVSHDRGEIFRLCDRLVVMHEGKGQKPCTKEELFHRPKTLAATLLSGCKNISRAQKISPCKIKALDWDVVLITNSIVEDTISHVGIRAHHIQNALNNDENIISCRVQRVIEDAFSQILLLKSSGKELLRWEMDKNNSIRYQDELYITIPKDKLILVS